MSKHRHRRSYRNLGIEQMESRRLLANNVQAFISDNSGNLVIRGSTAYNQVRISVGSRSSYFVEGWRSGRYRSAGSLLPSRLRWIARYWFRVVLVPCSAGSL